MALFKPKNRMISFRLSEDEYECLRQISLNYGARSVSDYARSALCRLATGAPDAMESPETRIEQIDQKMRELDREVQRLVRLLEQPSNHSIAEETAMEAAPGSR